ncbi:MAG: hypothetical protein ABIE70_04545 [bacterium]
MLRICFCIATLLWWATALADDGISVSQSISTDSVAYEDSVRFEIVIQWTGSQADYRFEKALQLHFDKLRPGAYSTSVSSRGADENEITTKIFRYTLIPNAPGLGLIEPTIIDYVTWPDSTPGQLATQAMTVQVAPPRAVVRSDDSIRWWLWLVVLAIAGGAAVGFFWWRLRNKPVSEPVERPVDRFKRHLAQLKEESGSDWKKFQSGLADLMALLFRDQFGVQAVGMDESELTTNLSQAGLAAKVAEALAAAYSKAEKDKFRPVSAGPGEVIRCESELQQLVSKI